MRGDEPVIMTTAPFPIVEFVAGEASLFVNDRELHRRLAPHMGRESFRAAIRQCEKKGFPEENALWRARYWPAVKLWLDRENGIGSNQLTMEAQDGPENFDATTRQHSRS